jgi:hypothetical protein
MSYQKFGHREKGYVMESNYEKGYCFAFHASVASEQIFVHASQCPPQTCFDRVGFRRGDGIEYTPSDQRVHLTAGGTLRVWMSSTMATAIMEPSPRSLTTEEGMHSPNLSIHATSWTMKTA